MKTSKFKMTEIGEIPADWDTSTIASFATVETGNRNTQDKCASGLYPFYVRSPIVERIDDYGYDTEGVITVGDGVGTGKVFHYVNGKFALHQRCYLISNFREDIWPRYFYMIFSTRFFDRVMQMTAKSSVDSVRREMITGMEIPIPPLAEQKAIAEALSDVDALIAAQEELIEKKRAIKHGAMQELLTGKKRLPGFGGEWRTLYLGSIADIRTGKRNGDEQKTDGIYPFFVRSQNIYSIDTYSYDGEAIVVPGEGGIGSIFHYINGKFDFHQRVYKVSDFPNNISCKYVYYYMKHFFGTYALQNTVKATVDSLRLPTFQNFTIDLPPSLAEQKAIAEVLSDMDAEIGELEAQKAKFESIKQGMMQELLTGKTRLV